MDTEVLTAISVRNAKVALAWHDVTCPESEDCRDREIHAAAMPLGTSGILDRFMDRLRGMGVPL